jgi:hypothetical protein
MTTAEPRLTTAEPRLTTAEPDSPLTAADLLYGSAADAPKALTRQIMSAGHAQSLGQALKRLPRVTREAAAHEAALAAAVLLKVDLMDILVAGWREHRDIISAARRTLAGPGSKELVGVAPHRISTVQQPAVSILLDGRRVHTLQLGLSIIFDVTGLVAGVQAGRLAGIRAGRCEIGVALTIHEIEVLTKRAHHLELPGVKSLGSGLRLLPAGEYLDADHLNGQHLNGGRSGGPLPGTAFGESRFPAVALADVALAGADRVGADRVGAEHSSSQYPGAEHSSSQYPGAEHQSSQYPGGQHASAAYSGREHPGSGPPAAADHRPATDSPPSWWDSAEPVPPPDRRF